MSLRIALDDGPRDFYTNLDFLSGQVVLNLNRAEQIGAVVVKLEGEAHTVLGVPSLDNTYPGNVGRRPHHHPGRGGSPAPGSVVHENHKVLYRVQQVFPDQKTPAHATPFWLQPGPHTFHFRFKIPMHNMCSDRAVGQIGGLAGSGGYGDGVGLFGMGGIRVMDGSRQLLYDHVTATLPPTLTGLGPQAEVTYFVKVTVQRPGLLKENWRHQINFRLLPLEPPRAPPTGQEAYARRPFTFRPRSPSSTGSPGFDTGLGKKKSGFFGISSPSSSALAAAKLSSKTSNNPFFTSQPSPAASGSQGESSSNGAGENGGGAGAGATGSGLDQPLQSGLPPSVEISARIPFPSILTVGQPIPLRLISRKLAPSREQAFLTSLHIELIGNTVVRCQGLTNTEEKRWVIVSRPTLAVPVLETDGPVGSEVSLPASLWSSSPLPSGKGQAGMTPSFGTCNLTRTFRLEIKLGVSWGLRASLPRDVQPQAIFLPLIFNSVDVYSGMTPPDGKRPEAGVAEPERPPTLPPRRPTGATAGPSSSPAVPQQQQTPQPQRPQQQNQVPVMTDEFEPPPPSYEEAMNSKN